MQQHGLFKTKSSQHPFKISIAERKVLIVLCYFVLLVVVSLTALAVTIRNSGKFATTLVEYWQCEATGVDPGKQSDRLYALFEELGPPALIGISNLLYLILPLVNLIFVINVTELKQKFKTWRGQTSIRRLLLKLSTNSKIMNFLNCVVLTENNACCTSCELCMSY